MILETKTNNSSPVENFLIDSFTTPFRSDRGINGGGFMLYVREDIPENLLVTENEPLEGHYMESNLRNTKWLLNCSYNPHKSMIEQHLAARGKYLDLYSSNYEKILIPGDFNFSVKENHMKCL